MTPRRLKTGSISRSTLSMHNSSPLRESRKGELFAIGVDKEHMHQEAALSTQGLFKYLEWHRFISSLPPSAGG